MSGDLCAAGSEGVVLEWSAVTGSPDVVKGVDYSATVAAFRKEHRPIDDRRRKSGQ